MILLLLYFVLKISNLDISNLSFALLSLHQPEMNVKNFPHDCHSLCIRLGILQNRQAGAVWDRKKWALSLATEDDTHGSTKCPCGLVVDNLKIPEYSLLDNESPIFHFVPLPFGSTAKPRQRYHSPKDQENCLEVRIAVFQDSTYYDR